MIAGSLVPCVLGSEGRFRRCRTSPPQSPAASRPPPPGPLSPAAPPRSLPPIAEARAETLYLDHSGKAIGPSTAGAGRQGTGSTRRSCRRAPGFPRRTAGRSGGRRPAAGAGRRRSLPSERQKGIDDEGRPGSCTARRSRARRRTGANIATPIRSRCGDEAPGVGRHVGDARPRSGSRRQRRPGRTPRRPRPPPPSRGLRPREATAGPSAPTAAPYRRSPLRARQGSSRYAWPQGLGSRSSVLGTAKPRLR